MGQTSSKSPGKVVSMGKPGEGPASMFPQQAPYNGLPINYHFVVINATLDVNAQFSFVTPNVNFQSTNIESYYPHLKAMYEQGYRMLVFVALPGGQKTFGLSNIGHSQMNMKFQGIFRQQFPEESAAGERWELRVEKSAILNQMFLNWGGNLFLNRLTETGSMTDSNHIFQTINNVTQDGGRLISIELTGMAGQQLEMQRNVMQRQQQLQYWKTGQYPAFQICVDVFFEVPLHPTSERYTYQIVNCPIDSTYQHAFPRGQFVSACDWQGIMQAYMGTGWRLVEIFEDQSMTQNMNQAGITANISIRKNCLWIFEKPFSRMNDNTPYYEGTMFEHWFTTKIEKHAMGFGGMEMTVDTNWEGLITHMGRSGWQVVRIMDTPDQVVQGTFSPTVQTKQWIFFQRKVGSTSLGAGVAMTADGSAAAATGGPPAPPVYDSLYPESKQGQP